MSGASQNRAVREDVWSSCQRNFSHSYSTILSQRYPTLHCQQCWIFFHSQFQWLVEVWVRSEHPNRPLSLSVPQNLSLNCASLKCNHLVCIWDYDPQSLTLTSTVGGYAFHLPSDPYLMQTASMNSCLFTAYPITLIGKADSQEDAPFSIATFMSCCDSLRGHFCQKFITDVFAFFSGRILFFVSGKLLVWGVVVKIELLSVYCSC